MTRTTYGDGVMYVYLSDEPVAYSRCITDLLIVDYSAAGRIVGVERIYG